MKTTDLFKINRTASKLNESLAKTFGKKLNLESFDLPQLEDARNKLRTQVYTARSQANFNETVENETLTQAQWMLDTINAEIAERQELIADAHTAEIETEGVDVDQEEVMDLLKRFERSMNELGGYGDIDHAKVLSLLKQGNVEAAVDIAAYSFSDQDGGEIAQMPEYANELEAEFTHLLSGTGESYTEGFDEPYQGEAETVWIGDDGEEVEGVVYYTATMDPESGKISVKLTGGDVTGYNASARVDDNMIDYLINDPDYSRDYMQDALEDAKEQFANRDQNTQEAAADEPAAPDADAIARRKRLQAIKDRQEDERASGEREPSHVRKIAGKAYGGAAQKDDSVDEVAPPGAKAERMVKHIKKGYAKDGKLSDKERSIAYATAWKQHNKNESVEGDNMATLREGEIQQAQSIVTAKTMVDRVGRWIEELSGMENDTLLQLGDQIRDEQGQEAAKTFISSVAPAIQQALENLKSTREALASGVRTLTGEEQSAAMLGAEPEAEMGADDFDGAAEPDAMNPEIGAEEEMPADDFAAAEPAAGGMGDAGRMKRESIDRSNSLLKVLAG